jgi:polysaccharide biosynthesis protein VpsM
MKYLFRIALVSASLATASHAAPFLAVGDGAELFLTGALAVRVDDNVFLDQSDLDDVIFDITPGLDFTFGKGAQLQGSLAVGVAFANYTDNSKLNTTLFNSSFVSRFDDGKLKLGFNLGYNELNQNAPDIRGLTRRDVFATGGNAEVEISAKSSIGAGVAFNHENYKRASYGDSDSLTVPLNFYYELTPKVDLSLGYRIKDYEVDLGSNSTDHFFSVGARGEFSPKLTGTVAVGVNTRDLSPGGSESLLGLDVSLAYELTPKTSLQAGATNDFGTTPQGQQQKNFSLNAAVMTKLTEEWSLNGGLSYRATNYGTRTDDYWEGNIGGAYIVNASLRMVGTYVHRKYISNISSSEFSNNVFSVAANFRY